MRIAHDALCPIPECGGSIRVVVDDGRDEGESDGESMRVTAMRILDKHGGWKCDRCDYRCPMTTELLEAIHRATSEDAPGSQRASRAAIEDLLNAIRVSEE